MRMLAQIDWQPLFEDHGIPLAIMGLFVVFSALVLVRVFIGLLPRIMAVLDHLFPEQTKTLESHAVSTEASSDALPDEILAIIAAVVADTVREPHRIVHTRELTPEDLNWTLEGRLQHHASHKIHRGHK